MNNQRRKLLAEIMSRIEEIKGDLELLAEEEGEYRDGIPENLQCSERYEKAESACDNLDSAISSLEETIDAITEATN